MNNKKGHVILGVMYLHMNTAVATVLSFKMAFLAITGACIWHIPAWEKAKHDHTEAIYQAQKMWPQDLFQKLPGAKSETWIAYKNGNGGNFVNGIDKV